MPDNILSAFPFARTKLRKLSKGGKKKGERTIG
jgi:hypothetical protein